MLQDRTYQPNDGDILYHYCDASAFHAICTKKKMRFSDISSMNDFLEMHWGYSIWKQLHVDKELNDSIGKSFLDEIDKVFSSSGMYALPVISCYSLDADVLSQWRSYADDGKGFAIGFNPNDMLQLPIRPLKVLYDQQAQIEELKETIMALFEAERSRGMRFGHDFMKACFPLAVDFAAFKNPAFKEENEVRLVHVLNYYQSNNALLLRDDGGKEGGNEFGERVKGMDVQFRMRDNAPIAFIEYDFTCEGKVNPIKEVIIGPKNLVKQTSVSVFLETIGIASVTVKYSKASYR